MKKLMKHLKEEKRREGFDNTISERWMSGIPYEIAFWRSYYRSKSSRTALLSWSQMGRECKLDHFDIASYLSGLDEDAPVIVDAGCALSYVFSNIIGGKEYEVTYMDPLAPFYNRILDDYSLPYPRITFGMGETLSLHFLKDSVTFFHIRNALDHSVRPMMVIWQALLCLRNGGIIYLNHKPNEAEHEAYMGFHQYNIDCQNGRLIIWNKEERVDVAELLTGYADVKVSVTENGRVIGIITKTGALPPDHPVVMESGRYAAGMLETMLTYFHNTGNTASYQWRKGMFTVAHGFMRLLPSGVVKNLKRLISGKK